jgi:hypothetical protein
MNEIGPMLGKLSFEITDDASDFGPFGDKGLNYARHGSDHRK